MPCDDDRRDVEAEATVVRIVVDGMGMPEGGGSKIISDSGTDDSSPSNLSITAFDGLITTEGATHPIARISPKKPLQRQQLPTNDRRPRGGDKTTRKWEHRDTAAAHNYWTLTQLSVKAVSHNRTVTVFKINAIMRW